MGPIRTAILALCGLTIMGGLSAGQASIFDDAGIYPGEVIINTVTGASSVGPIPPAEARLVISQLPPDGELRAYAYADGSPRAAGMSSATSGFSFGRSEYSTGDHTGPFTNSPAPVDRSGRQGRDILVPLGVKIPVEQVDAVIQGVPVLLVMQSHSMNVSRRTEDSVVVRVRDESGQEEEYVRLHEQGPDSGIFTGWLNTGIAPEAVPGAKDGMITTAPNSRLVASVGGDALSVKVELTQLNPANFVFDSVTGAPLSGVTVRLLDSTGAPARVLGTDLRSAFPHELITGSSVKDASGQTYSLGPGEFVFPHVPSGDYRLELGLPAGYAAPSEKSHQELVGLGSGYTITPASLSMEFSISPGQMVDFDVPVDRIMDGMIQRTAQPSVVEVGDMFRFEVDIAAGSLGRMSIEEDLPAGMKFIEGSLTINGSKADVVTETAGRKIVIPEFDARGAGRVELRYAARVLPGVPASTVLHSRTTVIEQGESNRRMSAGHDLRLLQAFNLSEVTILGQISSGGCGAPQADHDLSGIRVLLESGDFAITDRNGRFHFAQIAHRPRVVQIDANTLPRHATLVSCVENTRSAGSPRSRFVDVRPGMMARVDFHLLFDEAAMKAEDALALRERSYDPSPGHPVLDQDWLDAQEALKEPRVVTPEDGALPQSAAIDIAVLRRPNEKTSISVNGKPVPSVFSERSMINARGDIHLDRYRAVRIREGRNSLEIRVLGTDGEEVFSETRQVLLASRAEMAEMLSMGSALESDGRTQPMLRFRLTDRNDIPLRAGSRVRVSVDEPHALMPLGGRNSLPASRLRPQKSIDTVVRDDGLIEFRLAPVLVPGTAKVTIHAGSEQPIVTEVRINVPERPWVLVGLAEGTIAERHVRRHMRRSGDVENDLNGRVSLFAEGLIRGEWLMTLRVDTGGDGGRGFSGLDPDRDYIVYGDQSYQDDAAPSRFPLYLRLSKEGAHFLVGNFVTDISTNLIELNRKMTGVQAVRETENFRIMAFAAESSQRHVEDRISVDGTIGPYSLSRQDIVPHSETVHLVNLSRIDADEAIAREELVEGRDYVISYATGEIILRRPVPAFDASMRRNVLRVTYETDEAIASGMTAGVRAEVQISERARIGGTVLHERNSDGLGVDVTIIGLDVEWRASDALTLSAEIAATQKDDDINRLRGSSGELRAEYDDGDSAGTAYLRSRSGNGLLDADMAGERVDTAGLEFSMLLDAPTATSHEQYIQQREDRIGTYLEGHALHERNRDLDSRRSRGEVMLMRRDEDLEQGLGFAMERDEDASGGGGAFYLASHSGWKVNDFTFSAGVKYALSSDRQSVKDRMAFSVDHALSDDTGVFVIWDGAHSRDSGAISGILSAGYRIGRTSGEALSFGVSRGFAPGGSGAAIFMGGEKEVAVTDRLSASFGLDSQKDLGLAEVPIGQTYGDPISKEAFTTARSALRYSEESWSSGVQAEHRWSAAGNRGNIRLSADGTLSEAWSMGGDANFGKSTESISVNRSTRLRFSVARRGAPSEAIDLFSIDYRAEKEGEVADGKIYASWLGNRQISERDELTLRYALKHQVLESQVGRFSGFTHLAGLEFRHDLNEKLDLGLHAAAMGGAGAGSSFSAGLSVGVTPFGNSGLSLGYNFFGFREETFSETGETGEGAFLQLRMKFDQDIIRGMFR